MPVAVRGPRRLGGQPLLADPRLAGQQHELALPVPCRAQACARISCSAARPIMATACAVVSGGGWGMGAVSSDRGSHCTAEVGSASGSPLSVSCES